MKEIKVRCLSDEAFRKYGVYQKLTADAEMKNRALSTRLSCGTRI